MRVGGDELVPHVLVEQATRIGAGRVVVVRVGPGAATPAVILEAANLAVSIAPAT